MKSIATVFVFILFVIVSNAFPQSDVGIEIGVNRAIQAVYPALVQIHVVVSDYQGGRAQRYEAAGSGVIISEDGYVITNHHVAGKATSIRCVLTSKEQADATLVGTDALTDISVLKLNLAQLPEYKGKLPFARFAKSEPLRVGDPVLAMGCPLALSQSVTKGIIANRELIFSQQFSGPMILDGEDVGLLVRWIAHDAKILPGNSGGPLVNLQGEIVGINEIGIGGGLGGAIPSELAQSVANQLIQTKHVKRSWIGAEFQPLLKASGETAGVTLATVIPESPAEKAGLQPGDIVTSINEIPVHVQFREELPPLNRIILSSPIGSTLQIGYLRDRKANKVPVVTVAREDPYGQEQESKEWGIVVEEVSTIDKLENNLPAKRGVLVSSVRSGGPADQADVPLKEGDWLESIAGKSIADREAFFQITADITKNKTVPVPTLVAFKRKSEELVTVVDVGIRAVQSPTPEARKAWLPVEVQVLSRKLATAMNLSGKKGVRITSVVSGSTAERAGLQIGDVITEIDGQAIEASEPQDTSVFDTMIRAYKIDSKPQLTIVRDGKTLEIPVQLTMRPKEQRELPVYESAEFEFKARDLSQSDRIDRSLEPNESGVLVTQVERTGWAGLGGLREGDLIQRFNQKPVKAVQDLKTVLDAAVKEQKKYSVILVKRGIRTLFLELEPVWPEKS